MSYNGIEIEMLSLGDADCILLTEWVEGRPRFTLIDGGHQRDFPKIMRLLKEREVGTIRNLISTHPDLDHIDGLASLVKEGMFPIEHAWVHDPWQHQNVDETKQTLTKLAANNKRAEMRLASLRASQDLLGALRARPHLTLHEPFADAGSVIDRLTVCSPTIKYYEDQLSRFRDRNKFWDDEAAIQRKACCIDCQKLAKRLLPQASSTPSPENNSCVVCKLMYEEDTVLFTADAGVEAIKRAIHHGQIGHCSWMQIPHHGSGDNMGPEIVDNLQPKTAFVSAEGRGGHPAPEVVQAFQEHGCCVFSTHHPSQNPLWFSVGNVPPRPEYAHMTPLPDGWNGKEAP